MMPARIFLVVWWFDRLGGMERHVTDLAIALARRGIAVTVFSEKPAPRGNPYVRALRDARIAVVAPSIIAHLVERIEHKRLYRIISAWKRLIGGGQAITQHFSQVLLLRSLARQAAVAPPSIVHLHGCRLGQRDVLQWAAARGIPSVYTEHTTIADWGGPFDADSPGIVGRVADALACVSEHSRASLLACLPWPRDIHVVRHIVRASDRVEGAADRPCNRPIQLLAVGRLAAHKGYATLLAAAAALQAGGVDFHLRIAGDGEQRAELEALRTTLALAERVTFLGRVEPADIAALWRAADIGVLPSHSEGLPLAIVEAMAEAKPVVATRVGGIPEVIADGENGLLVEVGDAAGLAAALHRLITDAALARRLAEGARRSYEFGGWSEASVIDHHLALYDAAARARATRPVAATAAPIRRVMLLAWRIARFGMMEAALCNQALLLARAGVEVLLLVERPISPGNAYVRRMRSAGVRVRAPSPWAAILYRVAAWRRGPGIATPLQRAFMAECVARTPDVVQIHGWGLGQGWASLPFVLQQAEDWGVASVYTEHADAPAGANAAPCLGLAGALSAASPGGANALRGATGRIVTEASTSLAATIALYRYARRTAMAGHLDACG